MSDANIVPFRKYDDYFGACPICRAPGQCRNLYRHHWFYCSTHRVKWCVGSNLMSGWMGETNADWRANWEMLRGYSEIREWHRGDGPAVVVDLPEFPTVWRDVDFNAPAVEIPL
jgi:hypothetical protein